MQVVGPHPGDLLVGHRPSLASHHLAKVDREGEPPVGIGMVKAQQLQAHSHGQAHLLLQLPHHGFRHGLAGFLLAAGKLPKATQKPVGLALADEHFPLVIQHNAHANHEVGNGCRSLAHRELALDAPSVGMAMEPPRAVGAQGRTGAADQGAQVHQGLVEISRPSAAQQQLNHGPEQGDGLLWRGWKGQKAGQQTPHVAIQNGLRTVAGCGGNGGRCGATEARQPFKTGAVTGKWASGGHQPGGDPMQSPCSHVVAQPLPAVERLLLGCGRQGLQIREPIQPTAPEGERHRQLGLLQHHLRHPDGIGGEQVVRSRLAAIRQQAPRQTMAAMACPPTQQAGDQPRGSVTQPGFLLVFKCFGPWFWRHGQSQAAQLLRFLSICSNSLRCQAR